MSIFRRKKKAPEVANTSDTSLPMKANSSAPLLDSKAIPGTPPSPSLSLRSAKTKAWPFSRSRKSSEIPLDDRAVVRTRATSDSPLPEGSSNYGIIQDHESLRSPDMAQIASFPKTPKDGIRRVSTDVGHRIQPQNRILGVDSPKSATFSTPKRNPVGDDKSPSFSGTPVLPSPLSGISNQGITEERAPESPRHRSQTDPPTFRNSPLIQRMGMVVHSIAPDTDQSHLAQSRRLFQRMFPQLHFTGETIIKTFSCAIEKDIIMQGRMFLTSKTVCFYTNVFNRSYHLAVPFQDISLIEKRNTIGFVPNAIRITTSDEVHHSFISFTKRDLAYDLMMEFWTHCCQRQESQKSDPMHSPEKSKFTQETPLESPSGELLSASEFILRTKEMPNIEENIISAEEKEESYIVPNIFPNTCGCSDHYAWDIMRLDLRSTSKKLFNEVFGEDHYLWTSVHKKTGTNGLFIGNWLAEPDRSWKRNLVYSSLIKIPNLNGEPVFCMESQTLRKIEHSKTLIIESKIKIQKAAFLEPFNILTRYCVYNVDSNSCTLLMTAEVQYAKKGQSKPKIDSAVMEWLLKFRSHLSIELENATSSRPSGPILITTFHETDGSTNSPEITSSRTDPLSRIPDINKLKEKISDHRKLLKRGGWLGLIVLILVLLYRTLIPSEQSLLDKKVSLSQRLIEAQHHLEHVESSVSSIWEEIKDMHSKKDPPKESPAR